MVEQCSVMCYYGEQCSILQYLKETAHAIPDYWGDVRLPVPVFHLGRNGGIIAQAISHRDTWGGLGGVVSCSVV